MLGKLINSGFHNPMTPKGKSLISSGIIPPGSFVEMQMHESELTPTDLETVLTNPQGDLEMPSSLRTSHIT